MDSILFLTHFDEGFVRVLHVLHIECCITLLFQDISIPP